MGRGGREKPVLQLLKFLLLLLGLRWLPKRLPFVATRAAALAAAPRRLLDAVIAIASGAVRSHLRARK